MMELSRRIRRPRLCGSAAIHSRLSATAPSFQAVSTAVAFGWTLGAGEAWRALCMTIAVSLNLRDAGIRAAVSGFLHWILVRPERRHWEGD